MEITKDMLISEVARCYPDTASVFTQFGLHCFGCAVAKFETIEQGALAHGIDVDTLITDLNKIVASD